MSRSFFVVAIALSGCLPAATGDDAVRQTVFDITAQDPAGCRWTEAQGLFTLELAYDADGQPEASCDAPEAAEALCHCIVGELSGSAPRPELAGRSVSVMTGGTGPWGWSSEAGFQLRKVVSLAAWALRR